MTKPVEKFFRLCYFNGMKYYLQVSGYALFLFALVGCNQTEKELRDPFIRLDAVASTYSFDSSKVIYSRWDTSVCIFDLDKKDVILSIKTLALCFAKPILKQDRLYFPFSDTLLICVDMKSQKKIWELPIKRPCRNFDFVQDTLIVASIKNNGLLVIDAIRGKVLYDLRSPHVSVGVPGLSSWSLSADSLNIYVSNWGDQTLTCFRISDGKENWSYEDAAFSVPGKGIIIGNNIFVGTNDFYKGGKICLLDKHTGEIVFVSKCEYEERSIPVEYNGFIYFYSYDAAINSFDKLTNETKRIRCLSEEDDMGGTSLHGVDDNIYYANSKGDIKKYSITNDTITTVRRANRYLSGAYKFKGVLYYFF